MINLLDYKKILLLVYGGRGDYILMSPFIKNLRQYVGNDVIIDIVSNDNVKILIKNNPRINNFIQATYNDQGECEIYNRYDCVMNILMGYQAYSRNAIRNTTAVTYGLPDFDRKYDFLDYHLDYDFDHVMHEVDSSLEILKGAGVPIVDTELDFFFPKDFVTPSIEELDCLDFSKTIAVAPFGSGSYNSYSHMNCIVDYIMDNTKYNVILFGTTNNRVISKTESSYINKSHDNRIINTIDKLDIFTYAYYLGKCFAYIGTGSLSSHIAAYYKVPTLYLNPRKKSDQSADRWNSYHVKNITVYTEKNETSDIPVEDAIDGFKKLLDII